MRGAPYQDPEERPLPLRQSVGLPEVTDPLTVVCEVCGAVVGAPCVVEAGGPAGAHHAGRAVDARKLYKVSHPDVVQFLNRPMSPALKNHIKRQGRYLAECSIERLRELVEAHRKDMERYGRTSLDNQQAAYAQMLMCRQELARREGGSGGMVTQGGLWGDDEKG